MTDLDLEALRNLPRASISLPPEFAAQSVVTVEGETWEAILAALERAQRLETAAKEVLEIFEDDPEYAAEWESLIRLRHVVAKDRDG